MWRAPASKNSGSIMRTTCVTGGSRFGPRRQAPVALVARRCTTADAVAEWVKEVHGHGGMDRLDLMDGAVPRGVHGVHPVHRGHLSGDRGERRAGPHRGGVCAAGPPIAAQAAAFTEEGGFTERLHRIRSERSKHTPDEPAARRVPTAPRSSCCGTRTSSPRWMNLQADRGRAGKISDGEQTVDEEKHYFLNK